MPKGCTWGLFDKDGKRDVFGTLNILTKDVVQAAFAEARDGISVWVGSALCEVSSGAE